MYLILCVILMIFNMIYRNLLQRIKNINQYYVLKDYYDIHFRNIIEQNKSR